MERNDIFYPMLTYPARGSREPQIKMEPIVEPYQPRSMLPTYQARKTKQYEHRLNPKQRGFKVRKGKAKPKKVKKNFLEDKGALWRYYRKNVANQEVMHVGDQEAEAFFKKWKKISKKEYDKSDELFRELQAFVIQYMGFTGRASRQ